MQRLVPLVGLAPSGLTQPDVIEVTDAHGLGSREGDCLPLGPHLGTLAHLSLVVDHQLLDDSRLWVIAIGQTVVDFDLLFAERQPVNQLCDILAAVCRSLDRQQLPLVLCRLDRVGNPVEVVVRVHHVVLKQGDVVERLTPFFHLVKDAKDLLGNAHVAGVPVPVNEFLEAVERPQRCPDAGRNHRLALLGSCCHLLD